MEKSEILKAKKIDIDKNMKKIGQGSSRIVYDIGDNKSVIKYAIQNNKGIAQNRVEFELYKYAKEEVKMLCPIIDISKNDTILIMEKALPINKLKNTSETLKEKINIFKKKLVFIKETLPYKSNKVVNINDIKKNIFKKNLTIEQKKILNSNLFKHICIMIFKFNLERNDCFDTTSWGYYKGKFVLIDYGCTNAVYDKHYRNR